MRGSSWIGAIVRFIVSAIVLMVMGLVLPGFNVFGFVNALLAAIVIAAWAGRSKRSSARESRPSPGESLVS